MTTSHWIGKEHAPIPPEWALSVVSVISPDADDMVSAVSHQRLNETTTTRRAIERREARGRSRDWGDPVEHSVRVIEQIHENETIQRLSEAYRALPEGEKPLLVN